jgi:cobalamin synthase
MKPRDLFGIGVRLLGVWFWSQAIYFAFWAYMKYAETGLGNPALLARQDLAYACLYLLLGTAVFIGAGWLAWLAYGDTRAKTVKDEDPPSES